MQQLWQKCSCFNIWAIAVAIASGRPTFLVSVLSPSVQMCHCVSNAVLKAIGGIGVLGIPAGVPRIWPHMTPRWMGFKSVKSVKSSENGLCVAGHTFESYRDGTSALEILHRWQHLLMSSLIPQLNEISSEDMIQPKTRLILWSPSYSFLLHKASMWGRAFPALVALQAGRCEAVTVCGCPRLHADLKNPIRTPHIQEVGKWQKLSSRKLRNTWNMTDLIPTTNY